MNIFLFIFLPYTSIILFIIGSAYKYEFQIKEPSDNSHSDIIGINEIPLFNLGLGILIIGHIIGFLLPSYVLAWNTQYIRLLIIEVGAFGIGLATLFSLIIFIVRQIKKLLVRKQEAFFKSQIPYLITYISFVILLIAIISGLWVADFYRWGSSWYAGVLTPYLRSLIVFSPDISAVQLMPFAIKVHIITGFVIIGIFPFTWLFSFLVYTISYLSVKKHTNFLYTYGLIGAGTIATCLALYFGSSFEEKKSNNKLNLTTTDNKVIEFENKVSSVETLHATSLHNNSDTTTKQSNNTDTTTNKAN